MFIRMTCPYGHDEANNCCELCAGCEQPMCLDKDAYEFWIDEENYCLYCMSAVVQENSKTMTLDELCDCWDNDNEYIYAWLYETDEYQIKECVSTIESWWFIQRKKMYRKPTKSAQKKQ